MSKKLFKGCFGGFIYYLLELIWNGHSHWTMFVLGGLCFRMLSYVRNIKTPIAVQCVLGGTVITLAEFLAGILLNVELKLNIWDYSSLPFNVLGQICLPFTIIWTAISFPAIKIDQFLDTKLNI